MNQITGVNAENAVILDEIMAADTATLKGRRKQVFEIVSSPDLSADDIKAVNAILAAERARNDARQASDEAARAHKKFMDAQRTRRARELIALGLSVRQAKLPESDPVRLLAGLMMLADLAAPEENPWPDSDIYMSEAREIIENKRKK